ncbi:MAG: AraC family transcriptional regulator [Hungatella hathewayi]|uniref:AraC family transcriptional regulator n=1 Tax=Hungatella TaxID=1649459 RepID=UPI00110587C4|nr:MULTISPECIES: helix-turn-helix domain-containing protein [Hungatella]MCI7383963.1 AraC family transcriptional regulator [Hungatella sp.]MDY6237011.1 AraC family transcriptional regulator [Hungatella hathewayi]
MRGKKKQIKIKNGRNFYILMGGFLIIILISSLVIGGQYISYMNRMTRYNEKSLKDMAEQIFENNSLILRDYDAACTRIKQEVPNLEFLSAMNEHEDDSVLTEVWDQVIAIYNTTMAGRSNAAYLFFENSNIFLRMDSDNTARINKWLEPPALEDDKLDQLTKPGEEQRVLLAAEFDKEGTKLYISTKIIPGVRLIGAIADSNIINIMTAHYIPEGGNLFLLTEDGEGIYAKLGAGIEKPRVTISDLEHLPSGAIRSIGEQEYYVYYSWLQDNRMVSVFMVPAVYRERMHNAAFRYMVTVMIIWLLMAGPFAYLMTKRLYRPMKELLRSLPTGQVKAESFDEYRIIEEAFSKIKKDSMIYREQLKKENKILSSHLFMRLMHGDITMTQEVAGILVESGFPEELDIYFAVYIQILLPYDEMINEDRLEYDQIHQIYTMLCNHTVQCLEAMGLQAYLVPEDNTMSGIIKGGRERVEQCLNELIKTLKTDYSVEYKIAASSPCHTADELKRAYEEACEAAEYQLLRGEIHSLYFYKTEENAFPRKPNHQLMDDLRKLSNALIAENYDEAEQALDKIFKKDYPAEVSIEDLNRINRYVAETVILSTSHGGSSYEGEIRNCLKRYSFDKERYRDLYGQIQAFIEDVRNLEAVEKNGEKRKIDQIVFFIEEHYDDSSLSASMVAGQFQISVPWLSNLFKKELGVGFLDYVHKCRIRHAGELLRTTDMSVGEIAERVGYTSALTMSRAFKRYEGVTPKWFREERNKF